MGLDRKGKFCNWNSSMFLFFIKRKKFSGEKNPFSDKIISAQSLIFDKVFGFLLWHCPRKSSKIVNYVA